MALASSAFADNYVNDCHRAKNEYLHSLLVRAQEAYSKRLAGEYAVNHALVESMLSNVQTLSTPTIPVVDKKSKKRFAEYLKQELPEARKALRLYDSTSDTEITTHLGENIYGGSSDNFIHQLEGAVTDALIHQRGTYSRVAAYSCVAGFEVDGDSCRSKTTSTTSFAVTRLMLEAGFRKPTSAEEIFIVSLGKQDTNPSVPATSIYTEAAKDDHFKISFCREIETARAGTLEIDGLKLELKTDLNAFSIIPDVTPLCSVLDLRTKTWIDQPVRPKVIVLSKTATVPTTVRLANYVATTKPFPGVCPNSQ